MSIGCETAEGFIPHAKHPTMGFNLPVALDFTTKPQEGLYPPLKHKGKLVYALPGGNKGYFEVELKLVPLEVPA